MKILLVNPNGINKVNFGHQLFKNEIGNQHDVVYYGSGYPNFNSKKYIPEVLNEFEKKNQTFDFVLTYESKWIKNIKGLGEVEIPRTK